MPAKEFAGHVGWVFEGSPWVAERAASQRPFASVDELHAAMTGEVEKATREEQLALVRAHPDLGTRARMADASAREQAGAGLDRLTPDSFAQLTRLNNSYKERFGHPFLFAVKGSTVDDILGALETRLAASPEAEFQEALRQVYRIARFRLETLID
jgi:2-oxo-4-hydroxy-4-carboxy-5-ureidoimidazoline decarboxylase